eukprot:2336763-Pyramimonas_sp.AAC.1
MEGVNPKDSREPSRAPKLPSHPIELDKLMDDHGACEANDQDGRIAHHRLSELPPDSPEQHMQRLFAVNCSTRSLTSCTV